MLKYQHQIAHLVAQRLIATLERLKHLALKLGIDGVQNIGRTLGALNRSRWNTFDRTNVLLQYPIQLLHGSRIKGLKTRNAQHNVPAQRFIQQR